MAGRFIMFFTALLFVGLILIERNAFVQGTALVALGFLIIGFSVIGLSYSIAYQIQQLYGFANKKKEYLIVIIMTSFVLLLVLLNNSYFKYQDKKLHDEGQLIISRIDSVKYEERGKLAPDNYFYYSYKINGKLFRFSHKDERNYEDGQKIIVKYNPCNPGKHEILEKE